MPNSITPEMVSYARVEQTQQISIRRIARRLGVSESGLRYHLNGGKHASGAQEGDPLVEDAPDGLPQDPSVGYVEIPVIERAYDAKAHRVYPLGDVHLGSPAHAAPTWARWIDYIARTPDVSTILTGDLFNAALKGSKSESYDEVLTVGSALEQLYGQLRRIRDKIDLMIPGNHEARIYRAAGLDVIKLLADRLEVPSARASALVRHRVGVAEYVTFVRHGTGLSATTIGSQAAALERGAKVVEADIYISGHTHSQLVARDRVFEVGDDGAAVSRRRLYVASGSFLNYEDYAAERAYVAGEPGAPRIRLDGTRKDAHASI